MMATKGSIKWIHVDSSCPKPQIAVNNEVKREVFDKIGRKKCNLVSIFGAARQGKSFLMNCLADRSGLFTISNRSVPCTQGIDISRHTVSLKTFSEMDGGRPVAGNVDVGFVDAEGQGDRDVTYDANLVCPILLASKCVLLNWMDSVQKDKILNHLGIMHKAAINVATEGDLDNAHGEIFGNLHIVFRDWRFEGDENSVLNDIFREERGVDTASAVRNQIRRSVRSSFKSVNVWLLPPPTKDTQSLRTELTVQGTSPAFREKLRELRGTLAKQMQEPTSFNGRPLNGYNMASLVETVVGVLNAGKTISPLPAWVSMSSAEATKIQRKWQGYVRENLNAEEQHIKEAASKCDSYSAQFITAAELQLRANEIVEEACKQYIAEVGETVGDLEGDLEDEILTPPLRELERTSSDALAGHIRFYKEVLYEWLRRLVKVTMADIQSCMAATAHEILPVDDMTELDLAMSNICSHIEKGSTLLRAGELYGVGMEELQEYQSQLDACAEMQIRIYRDENEKLVEKVRQDVSRLLEGKIKNIRGGAEKLLKDFEEEVKRNRVVPLCNLTRQLDERFHIEKDSLEVEIRNTIKCDLDTSSRLTRAVSQLEEENQKLRVSLKNSHSTVAIAQLQKLSGKLTTELCSTSLSLLDNGPVDDCAELQQKFGYMVDELKAILLKEGEKWGIDMDGNFEEMVIKHISEGSKGAYNALLTCNKKLLATTRQANQNKESPSKSRKRSINTALNEASKEEIPVSSNRNINVSSLHDETVDTGMEDRNPAKKARRMTTKLDKPITISMLEGPTAMDIDEDTSLNNVDRATRIERERQRAKEWGKNLLQGKNAAKGGANKKSVDTVISEPNASSLDAVKRAARQNISARGEERSRKLGRNSSVGKKSNVKE